MMTERAFIGGEIVTKRVFIGVRTWGKDSGAVCLNQLIKQRSIAGGLKKGFDGQNSIERKDDEQCQS